MPAQPLIAMGLHNLATVTVLLVMEAAKVRGREEMPEAEIKTKVVVAVRKITIEANRRTKVTAHPHHQAMVPQPPVTMERHLRNLHRVRFLRFRKKFGFDHQI